MHSESNNVEIMRGISTDDITDMLITSFTERFQDGLETKMRGSSYVFNYINLLEYHFHRMSLNRSSLYMPTIPWVANRKCTFNPQNKKDKICFVYAMVLALSYHKITNNPHKLSNITPFIQNYNWNDINFSAGPKEYRAFEKYNDSIALNIFYVPDNEKYIGPVYISKFNKTCNYHANLLMITDGKYKWHSFAIRSLPASLRDVASTHNGDYYCLNCLDSYRTKKKVKEHEEICIKNHYGLNKKPTEKNKYISSTPGKNIFKNPFIIYADLESLLYSISTCDNTKDNYFTN